MQTHWTGAVESALGGGGGAALERVLGDVTALLDALAESVMRDLPAVLRKKFEHLVTELVHQVREICARGVRFALIASAQRDVTRRLAAHGVSSSGAFEWLAEMRYYYDAAAAAGVRAVCASRVGDARRRTAAAKLPTSTDAEQAAARLALQRVLTIRIANASFNYGWEYLGVGERLVQTPLTDRCACSRARSVVVGVTVVIVQAT
jgi:dynein heavy chain 1